MILCGIEINACRAEIYPETVFDKERSERRLKYVLCNYDSCVISHVWSESNVEKTKVCHIYRICFKLLGISSYFELFVNSYEDLVKVLGLLNVSCETSDENIAKTKEALEKL